MPTAQIERPIADVALTHLAYPNGKSLPIVSTQQAMGEHPNPKLKGRVVAFANIVEILVEDGLHIDGATMFTCTKTVNEKFCGKTWDTLLSAMAHTASHDANRSHTEYEPRVLRAVAQAVYDAKNDGGGRNFMERAADALNHRGFTTVRGVAWTSTVTSNVYNKHCRTLKVTRHRQPPPTTTVPVPTPSPKPVAALPTEISNTQRLVTTLSQAYELIRDACNLVTDSVNETQVTREELTELRDKARKWDQLRDSLK